MKPPPHPLRVALGRLERVVGHRRTVSDGSCRGGLSPADEAVRLEQLAFAIRPGNWHQQKTQCGGALYKRSRFLDCFSN